MANGDAETEDRDTGDAEVALRTGIRDQWLVVSGWGASHADTGTPGPHVHLGTNDGRDPVLRTSQIPELVDAVNLVGARIDRMWQEDGATWFTGDEPDDNDPAVIRRRRIKDLEFHDRVAANLPAVLAAITQAESSTDAAETLAPLLGVDDLEVLGRLSRFSWMSLTRGARAARAEKLAELRRQQ